MAIEKQKLILLSGIVLGVMAIAMTKMYLDQQQQAMQVKAKAAIANMRSSQTAVLVAKQDIPQGAAIEPEMFDTSIVPNKFVQPQAVTSLDRISGMVTVAPISKGEQISLSKLTRIRQSGGGNLSGVTPAGKRAISIVVDNLSSLAHMVRPGDYVDVLATIQIPVPGPDGKMLSQVAVIPLFQNVLILAVGQNIGGPELSSGRYDKQGEAPKGTSNLITLALTPQEASLIAFVQEQGKVRLTMRSPADAKIEPLTPASWEALFQYIMPQKQDAEKAVEKPIETVPAEPTEYVEVLRGLKKEQVSLPK
ncbi:MAG: Flp pilus assembly protein CpaB [Candidatus Omnitrophica bacterium]|nr:Flp pilus assembly protein CpaB [Candidatus Omnitrophota bacterium]MDD5501193.1 Flp pilus assembly protein CpaB [Candidatus Omnitrophota bacterium]